MSEHGQRQARSWHELQRSVELCKGVLAIKIHKLRNSKGQTSLPGPNPLDAIRDRASGRLLSSIYPIYDRVAGQGSINIGTWINQAAQAAGR